MRRAADSQGAGAGPPRGWLGATAGAVVVSGWARGGGSRPFASAESGAWAVRQAVVLAASGGSSVLASLRMAKAGSQQPGCERPWRVW
jgi:hypothetical protein